KAISYSLGQWKKIENYLGCAELTPDNNAAERAVKPFVLGRNYAELCIMLNKAA
ncbi:MAG: IS66 family transposase, partial [Spirochaetes bacterium]